MNQVEGLQRQFAIPVFVFMEIPIPVMHLDLVEMRDDVKFLMLDHLVGLVEETPNRLSDVAIEKLL